MAITRTEVTTGLLAAVDERTPVAGVVVVLEGETPTYRAVPVGATAIEIGRDDLGGKPVADSKMSRRHARIEWTGNSWSITDLDSRNGTFVNGKRVHGAVAVDTPAVVRVGNTLLLLKRDVRLSLARHIDADDQLVVGPALALAHDQVARAAQMCDLVLIRGESGVGKEHAARRFHSAGPHASGPFVAVNCATIPEGVAERVLFGATRGAYSGATADAEGVVSTADGGVLFLDEVAELALDVQAKLLRFLETWEVLPLGATRPRRVALKLVCATHRDLRAAVGDGSFRADLYYRLAQISVDLPPLRERLEEIPWLIGRELTAVRGHAAPHVSLVEDCLLRPWPGNVRELLAAVRRAVIAAGPEATPRSEHLAADAGREVVGPGVGSSQPLATAEPTAADVCDLSSQQIAERARVVAALGQCAGNQTAAAKLLGMSRKTLIDRMKVFRIPRPRAGVVRP